MRTRPASRLLIMSHKIGMFLIDRHCLYLYF